MTKSRNNWARFLLAKKNGAPSKCQVPHSIARLTEDRAIFLVDSPIIHRLAKSLGGFSVDCYGLPPGFACARGVGGFSRDTITKTSLKAFSDNLNLLSDSPRFGAVRRGSARLKVKQLAPGSLSTFPIIFKTMIGLERTNSIVCILAVDTVSAARTAIVTKRDKAFLHQLGNVATATTL